MHFSVLPLLLFTSIIWASPIHVERRTNSPEPAGLKIFLYGPPVNKPLVVDLPSANKGDDEYNAYYEYFLHGKPIEGVEGALKIPSHGDIIVRIIVKAAKVKPVATMINHLGEDLLLWKWNVIPDHDVAVTIRMKPAGEETVISYLAKPKNNAGSVTGTTTRKS